MLGKHIRHVPWAGGEVLWLCIVPLFRAVYFHGTKMPFACLFECLAQFRDCDPVLEQEFDVVTHVWCCVLDSKPEFWKGCVRLDRVESEGQQIRDNNEPIWVSY